MKEIIRLIRVRQWYKNLVVFLPFIFAKELYDLTALSMTILAFFALCFISSSNYVLNDIIDRKKDRIHKKKKNRPIASGKISVEIGLVLSIFLFVLSMYISLSLSLAFTFFVLVLFALTQLYSFWLKNEPFADLLVISINFVIRTISGAFILSPFFTPYVKISSWLILCPFFLALFLATAKRRAEAALLVDEAKKHRRVLGAYTEELTSAMLIISTTLLIMSYSLYTFFSPYPGLLLSLPFVVYIVFRYFYHVTINSELVDRPELMYKDRKLLLSIVFTGILVIAAIYFT